MIFQGEFDHSVDDKGRVIIPTKFRSSLGERCYMTKGLGGCLFVYTESTYKDLSETLARQKPLDEHTMLLQRFLTSSELYPDNQGRISIPARLRGHAKIGLLDEVVIVGTGSRIEIWSSRSWAIYNENLTAEMITEAAREVGIA